MAYIKYSFASFRFYGSRAIIVREPYFRRVFYRYRRYVDKLVLAKVKVHISDCMECPMLSTEEIFTHPV